jgi:hypothetical protein
MLYLALTCIDIFATNFEPFDKWLIKNCGDFNTSQNIKSYIESKANDYRKSFQLSSNFSRAFINASEELRDTICTGLSVQQDEQSRNDLESIVSFLYRIRNKYTHEGRRFHASIIPVGRRQGIGPRDPEVLIIEEGFNLADTILSVAKEQANRIIMKYADRDS